MMLAPQVQCTQINHRKTGLIYLTDSSICTILFPDTITIQQTEEKRLLSLIIVILFTPALIISPLFHTLLNFVG